MRLRALLLIAAMLVAACGAPAVASPTSGAGGPSSTGQGAAASTGGAGGTPAAAAPTACTLLTAADAQTALGSPVGSPTANQGSGSSNNCTYAPEAPAGLMTIELAVLNQSTFDQAKGMAVSGVTITPVSGLGDDAFFFDAGNAGTQLYVLKGGIAFYVALFNGNDTADQLRAAEKVAAQAVLGRI